MELNLENHIWEAMEIIQDRRNEIARLESLMAQRKAQLEELDNIYMDCMFLYEKDTGNIFLGSRNLWNSYRLMKRVVHFGEDVWPETHVFLTPNIDYLLEEEQTVPVQVLKYDLVVSTNNPKPRFMLGLWESFFKPLEIAYVHESEYVEWFTQMSYELQSTVTHAQVIVETQIGELFAKIEELKKLDVQR